MSDSDTSALHDQKDSSDPKDGRAPDAPPKVHTRRQTDLFRLLVACVRDYALFVLDPRGYVTTWNIGAERIKGYRADEIIGRHFSTFYSRSEVEAGKCERELEIASSYGSFEEEGWRVRKDGSLFWASVIITALRDEDGTLVGFAKVTRDLTDRLRAEDERLQLVRAQEADKRKDEFLSIIGHELRNPLSPMSTAVQLLKAKGLSEAHREIDVLERQLGQLTRLVDDLMDMAGTLRDSVQIRPEAIEVSSILARAIDVAAPLLVANDQMLEVDLPEHGLTVNVDIARMTQVFGNLLNNSAKYTQRGGMIRVRAFLDGSDVVVEVADNGRGIDAHEIDRVFDLFTQGERALNRRGGGLGVGLAVAKQFVKRHSGKISASSGGAGRGTTIAVRLPQHRAVEAPEVQKPERLAATATAPRRILVVDDNADGAELTQAALETLGHEVRVANSGDEALKIAHDYEPEVIFLDIGLPGLSGYDVVRELRKTDYAASIPIYALTGYANASHRAEALRAGFTEHVPKPINFKLLQSLLTKRT